MKRISKSEYDKLLKVAPMKAKRTKKGFYKLGANRWIAKDKKNVKAKNKN